MELWALWLSGIQTLIEALASGWGLGFAIVAATILVRAALLPISWPTGYLGMIRKKKLDKLAPDIEQIKSRFATQPERHFQEIQKLYLKNDLKFFDFKAVAASLVQIPVFFGMYRVLSTIGEGVRFLWVSNLAKPDLPLALLAAASTAALMAINPDMPEQMRTILILVPTVLALWAAMHFGSALAIYWTTSNCVSMLQTAAIRKVIDRRIRSGALKI